MTTGEDGPTRSARRVGIIGFGQLGQYLVNEVLKHDGMELAFVWNRDPKTLIGRVESAHILDNLDDMQDRRPDLVVEVAHPSITTEYAERVLQYCDFMVGSPTALAMNSLDEKLKQSASVHGLYIPSGALWGSEDIRKMADLGALQRVQITMSFHPECLKLVGNLQETNSNVKEKTVLYEGPVRQLCAMAPNNVNTMAAASIAAHNLGFDSVQGCLISDPSLADWHVIDVEVWGRGNIDEGKAFHVTTRRSNPAKLGQVTGSQTLAAFFSSLLRARGRGAGMHLC